MPIPAERRRSFLARQVATMALSHVQTDTPMAIVRASAWSNSLMRMGVHLPLFVIHDIGVMLSMTRGAGGYTIRAREAQLARIQLPPNMKPLLEAYRKLLENIAASEVTERLAGLRLRDEMVAVLLSRILGDTYNRWRDRSQERGCRAAAARPRHPRRDRLRGSLSANSIRAVCGASRSNFVAPARCTSTGRRADRSPTPCACRAVKEDTQRSEALAGEHLSTVAGPVARERVELCQLLRVHKPA